MTRTATSRFITRVITPGRLGLTAVLVCGLIAGAAGDLRAGTRVPGQQVAYEDVVANLKAGDPRVKLDALRMLSQAGYIEAAGPVTPLLNDSVAEVQNAAIDTLLSLFLVDEAFTRKYGAEIINSKSGSLPLLAFAQGPGALVANQFPPELVKGLVVALNSPVMEVRFNATYAFGVFAPVAARRGTVPDGKAAADRLTAMAQDPNPLLRLAATQVLGRLYEAVWRNDKANIDLMARRIDAGDQVIAGINDTDPYVKQASLKAVGEMRLERAVQSLIDIGSYYKTGGMARDAYEALARIANPGSLPALSAALQARDEWVRAWAVTGIGRIGDAAVIQETDARMARDKSQFVKLALAYSRARNGNPAQIVTVAEGFRKDQLAPLAFDYLLDLGPAVADVLAPAAAHKDAKVRAGIAEVLGVVGNDASVFVVQSLSRDRNRAVSEAGIRSVKRLSPRPSNAPRLM